jgi:hypothetical protein
MTAELLFDVTPDPRPQVHLRGIGGQQERADLVSPAWPPGQGLTALVLAHVVSHDDELLRGPCLAPWLQEGHQGWTSRAEAQLPVDRP